MSQEPRKLELSITQVLASALAAIVGAAASARLGTAGTFIGAGVVSVVATVGSAIFGHSLRHTRAKVQTAVQHHAELVHDGQALTQKIPMLGRVMPPPSTGDTPEQVQQDPSTKTEEPRAIEETTELPVTGGDASSDEEPPATTRAGLAARFAGVRWKPVVAVAVLVFALSVLGITIIELAGGRSLHNIETGKQGSGTSLSHVVNPGSGNGSTTTPTPTPTETTPTPSPTVTGGSTPTPSPSSSTSTPPSGQPSPSVSSTPQGDQTSPSAKPSVASTPQ